MRSVAFIDASNLFYGGQKSLGWKIDYKRLFQYLQQKYGISVAHYFGGVEIHQFPFSYLAHETVPIGQVEQYISVLIKNEGKKFNEAILILLSRHLQRVRFYIKLQSFGYQLHLKPVKLYYQDDGTTRRKANCDVEMAFYVMKEYQQYDRILVLSGDGDFLPVLKYIRKEGKEVVVMARGSRTAREIRQFAAENFRDFEYLKYLIKWDQNKRSGLI